MKAWICVCIGCSLHLFAEQSGQGLLAEEQVIASLEKGIRSLEALPKQDENAEELEVFFDPPERQRVKVGEESVTQRYRMVSVERPRYEWSTKEVLVQRKGSSEEQGGMVKKEVRVRGKQLGMQTVQIPKNDPNGPLSRTVNRPIFERNGPDRWRIGQLAANCMAALVLLRQEDAEVPERVQGILDELSSMVESFGPPECTMDLAWMLVLFAESGDEVCREQVPELLQRLVNAQLREGPGRGLWGAVAVDPEELAAWMEESARLTEAFDSLSAKLGDGGSRTERQKLDSLQLQLNEATEKLERMAGSYSSPSPRQALNKRETDFDEQVSFTTADEYIFTQRSADLEQTWMALYALRIAREQRLLPQSVTRVQALPGRRNGTRVQEVSVVQALHNAGKALIAAQHPSGAFPEMNIHQPVKAFDHIDGIPGVPVHSGSFEALPSPITLVSTAQGLSSLDQLRHILGIQAMRPYAGGMMRAKKLLDAQMDHVLEGNYERLGTHPLGVFALCMALQDSGPKMAQAPRDLLGEGTRHLLSLQASTGDWRRPFREDVWLPGTWRIRAKLLPGAPQHLTDEATHAPFVRLRLNEEQNTWDWRYRQAYARAYPVAGSAAALLTLQVHEQRRAEQTPAVSSK